MLKNITNFYERRLYVPVDKTAKILDVGSGDKPHFLADILCDAYPELDFQTQRASGGTAVVSAPLIVGDVQNLPFRDKAFDYVIASHLLEHVEDPLKSCQELMRVAHAGYIELPAAGMAKMWDSDAHFWWCRKEGSRLTFIAKTQNQFDRDIARFVADYGVDKWHKKVIHEDHNRSFISLFWDKSIDVRVEGEISDKCREEVAAFEKFIKSYKAPNKRWVLAFRLILGNLVRLVWRKNSQITNISELLRCPECHSDDVVSFKCMNCGEKIICRN